MSTLVRPLSLDLTDPPVGHAQRAIASALQPRPLGARDWCVCRFVEDRDGWPLRVLQPSLDRPAQFGDYGWHRTAPVAFFTEDEAIAVAAKCPFAIARDIAVHVTAIRWTVTLFSYYDGSRVEHKTASYEEAIMAFHVALAVERRENTPTVAYIEAGLDGLVPAADARMLADGARLIGPRETAIAVTS